MWKKKHKENLHNSSNHQGKGEKPASKEHNFGFKEIKDPLFLAFGCISSISISGFSFQGFGFQVKASRP
jgi:hypothetical protein